MQLTRHPPRHPLLKQLIKFFWVLKSKHPITLHHKLLPVNNIDIVLNFSSPMSYGTETGGEIVEIPRYSLSGIRYRYYTAHQTGNIYMIGVSFFPMGLYPFLRMPVSEITNRTLELNDVIHMFSAGLEAKIDPSGTVPQHLELLEAHLAQMVSPQHLPSRETMGLIDAFCSQMNDLDVWEFCDEQGINQRRLERVFNKYIGVNPKFFKKLTRFQQTLNRLLAQRYTDLTSLAYDNAYYDQAHFIRDFKSFTGSPPSQFVKEKKSLKEILTVS